MRETDLLNLQGRKRLLRILFRQAWPMNSSPTVRKHEPARLVDKSREDALVAFTFASYGPSSRTLRVIGMHRVNARSPRLTVRPSAWHPGKVLIGPGSSPRKLRGISRGGRFFLLVFCFHLYP